jgi:hypothetical protein
MWSIYGHLGIAIGTTIGHLRRAFPVDRSYQYAEVRYIDRRESSPSLFNPPLTEDDPRVLRPHFLKGAEYQHEKEVRIATTCDPNSSGVLISNLDWKTLIRQIVISPLLPYEESEAIKEVIRKLDWETPPEIARSSLLGRRGDQEGDRRAMEALLNENLVTAPERGLPSGISYL